MAIKLIGTKKLPNPIGDDSCEVLTAKEFLCDTDADFADLPECCPSSMAVSIESGKVYVVNTTGAWVEFGAGGAGGSTEPEKIKMFKTIVYENGATADFYVVTNGMATGAGILPTKTTDDVLESSEQNGMHLYYIEDENDIFMYGDMAGTGAPDWVSLSLMTGGEMGFNGAVEDISEITEEGYYALIYYIEPGKNFTMVGYNPNTEAVVSMVPHLMQNMDGVALIFEETILPTKTTDDIKLSDASTGVVYLYYIEDENIAATCLVHLSTGETMWVSVGEFMDGMPCLGVITDESEATDPNGYYVLMY